MCRRFKLSEAVSRPIGVILSSRQADANFKEVGCFYLCLSHAMLERKTQITAPKCDSIRQLFAINAM